MIVLGHKGMLGNCVYKYLSKFYTVDTIDYRFPDKEFLTYLQNYEGVIVNCIGAVPQKTDEFSVNHKLPEFLSTLDCKVIHPGTDCEDDQTPYGISKRIAVLGANTKTIKASVVGLGTDYGLLSWLLSQDRVEGYAGATWNGVTTLEWAKWCRDMIENWDDYDKETVICSDCISKHDLLLFMAMAFDKKITIKPVHKGEDKCLNGTYTKPIYEQLQELRSFYE